jgi:hypothetical protein
MSVSDATYGVDRENRHFSGAGVWTGLRRALVRLSGWMIGPGEPGFRDVERTPRAAVLLIGKN